MGTAVLTTLMYQGMPKMIGQRIDIASLIGTAIGNNPSMGLAVFYFIGAVVSPLVFGLVLSPRLPGHLIQKGAIWGIILWLVSQLFCMPMTGAGFFSSNIGGISLVIVSLIGHMSYGVILGAYCSCASCVGNCELPAGKPVSPTQGRLL